MVNCPYCNKSYYQENYHVSTAMYSPVVVKDGEIISHDPNYHTTHCTCLNCGHTFRIRTHEGETVVLE